MANDETGKLLLERRLDHESGEAQGGWPILPSLFGKGGDFRSGLLCSFAPSTCMKVSHLRRLVILETIYPALTHGANLCCAYGAEKRHDWKQIFFVENGAEGGADISPAHASCVKITSYDYPAAADSAPFFRALVVQQLPSLLGRRSRQRHLISLILKTPVTSVPIPFV